MTKYREILRFHSQGISSRNIAASLECSRNTIRAVLARATEEGIIWSLPDEMTDRVLEQTLISYPYYTTTGLSQSDGGEKFWRHCGSNDKIVIEPDSSTSLFSVIHNAPHRSSYLIYAE
jgi:hypothetical protein